MKRKDITIRLEELSYDELSASDRALVDAAREATHRSYAPYSHFRVGAAVLLDNGEIVAGANQENAAFPSSLCAERTAAYYAHSRYPEARFVKIAIAARDTSGLEILRPISPCGACRQALMEYETLAGRAVPVIMAGRDAIFQVPSVSSLLPLTFSEIV